jgi:hypothetical protein
MPIYARLLGEHFDMFPEFILSNAQVKAEYSNEMKLQDITPYIYDL